MQYVIKHEGCRQMALQAKKSDVTYFEKNNFQWLAKKNDVPDSLSSFRTFGHHSSLF